MLLLCRDPWRCPTDGASMKGTGQSVLYLDFDGVLHHENVWWHPKRGAYIFETHYQLFQHAALLEQLLAPYPEVQIVLSTSWVRRYGVSKSAKFLGPVLRKRVIGATFHSKMDVQLFLDLPRGLQVWADVVRRRPAKWLALDDVDDGWPAQARANFVKTDDILGISEIDTHNAVKTKLWQIFGAQQLNAKIQIDSP